VQITRDPFPLRMPCIQTNTQATIDLTDTKCKNLPKCESHHARAERHKPERLIKRRLYAEPYLGAHIVPDTILIGSYDVEVVVPGPKV
jgi:hypothetical protein